MRYAAILALIAITSPLAAQAPAINLTSAVYIERDDVSGRSVEPAENLRKGERIVTVMRWDAPGGNLTVTSPVPRALQFERISADNALVSTDGGRTWRSPTTVQPEDVTHLRWRVGRGLGQLSYSAIVR